MLDNIDKLYARIPTRGRFEKIPLTPEISSETKISSFSENLRRICIPVHIRRGTMNAETSMFRARSKTTIAISLKAQEGKGRMLLEKEEV